jgi:hypothetical protein
LLDITAACVQAHIQFGSSPARVLKGVASGLLGRGAYEGGIGIAALGLAMHFCVALTVAAVFYALARRMPVLLRPAALAGVVYGLAVFCVMNFAVLPFLSWFRSLYLHTPIALVGPMGWPQMIIHMFCVGVPVALATRRLARAPT